MWFFSKIWAEFWDFLDTRQNYGIMIAKAIIMVPTLPPKRQERHFAGGRKPVETQRIFHSIMIAKPIIQSVEKGSGVALAPSAEGAVSEADWGRENDKIRILLK